ncbi:MAG: heparinase II/III-family protein [Lachnospiraceae bacterium]|nr:heparinase II/III-family protein [Lachnospiraceae bacterium]
MGAEDPADGIHDLPGITDRAFWEHLPGEVLRALSSRAEQLLSEPVPALMLSDYREFSQNGNRVRFEERYFKRRIMLTQLVLAECAEDDGRFTDRILDLLWAILEESTWCLPAHNGYIRDTAALPLPDVTRPVIDLFAAETAAIVGLTEYLLRPRLETVSSAGMSGRPVINDRIDAQIRDRILNPYLSFHFWWMGDGKQPMCNWTPWITQNILLALFTRRPGCFDEAALHRAFEQAGASVDYYLADYGADGCCNEGAFYYGHSGLSLFGCYDLMNRITGNARSFVWHQPLVRNIASYIVKMSVGNGRYFNYSDASPFAGRRSAKDYLFAEYTDNPAYMSFAAADFREQSLQEKLMADEENLYDHLLQLLHWREMEAFPESTMSPEDAWFESTGLMVARDGHWALAAKAGDNGDSHNHNDIGSVTLYLDGKPFLIDLGVETYTAKTFSNRRYEIWTMQSAYHNTVNFGIPGEDGRVFPGILQRDGRQAAAAQVVCRLSKEEASLSMEMSGAYGDPRVTSCHRTVTLKKGSKGMAGIVRLKDRIQTRDGVRGVLTWMTSEKPGPVRQESGMTVVPIGTLGELHVSGISKTAVEICPITDERLAQAWRGDCYRILLTMTGTEAEVSVFAADGCKEYADG